MDKKKVPVLSIIMGTYNSEKYISEAVDSILKQTFTDFEFIIVDDGSVDKTASILKNFCQKDSRIKVLWQKENIGLARSLNRALNIAKGKYIARMDADDIALKERLEREIEFLEKNEDYSIVGTGCYFLNSKGEIFGEKIFPIYDKDIKKELLKGNAFLHSSVMIKREIMAKFGGYDEKFKFSQDYDLWLRMMNHCKMHNLPEKLMVKRFHYRCLTIEKKKEQSKYALKARINALKRGDYPLWALIYLIKPVIVSYFLPDNVTRVIRKKFLKSGEVFRKI